MQLLRIALLGVAGHWLRTLLSVVALSTAVIGVVTITAAGSTVETTVTERAIVRGGPSATLEISGLNGADGATKAESLAAHLSAYLGQSGTAVRVDKIDAVVLDFSGRAENINVVFTEPELIQIRPFRVLRGTWLPNNQVSTVALPIVVNEATWQAVGPLSPAPLAFRVIGASTPTPVVIRGIVDDGEFTPSAYADLRQSAAFFAGNDAAHSSTILLSMPGLTVDGAERQLASWNSLSLSSLELDVQKKDTVDQLANELAGTRSAFLVVSVAGLFAGGLGIANISLSAVRERAMEMSLRRALGARAWHIPVILLIESQVVAAAAGVLAVGASYFLYPSIGDLFGAPYGIQAPSYPWPAAVLGVCVGLITALAASLAPALLSLRTPITRILRA